MRRFPYALALLALSSSVGCAMSNTEEQDTDGTEAAVDSELTSASALSRGLTFDGVVYVAATASDADILATVRKQTQSAFGALRTSNVGVNSRELKDVDTKTFVKTKVDLVDGTTRRAMLKVTYRYTDNAVVPKSMARRSSLSLALLGLNYSAKTSKILVDCTDNDDEAREFSSSIWYVFNPSLSGCKKAVSAEQAKIDVDRQKLASPTTEVTKSEVERLYLPVTVKLGGDKTNKGNSYPEYDRLWSGGVQKGKLVIGLVNGVIDHDGTGELADDSGYEDFFATIREVMKVRPGLKLTKSEPAEDLTTFTVSGKTVKVPNGLSDAMNWTLSGTGYPAGLTAAQKDDLRRQMGRKIGRHWLTFSAPLTVSIGGASSQAVTLELQAYFGAESDSTPHKRAIKTSDVFIYNGHSYIGYGPLDPSRFTASDFPSSYQILFIDGCVSYNYYEKDYLPLKTGGTRNLDLITNGLEAPAFGSGLALGKFLGKLVDGTQASWLSLLQAAATTDSLRVVDGELDNLYTPSKTITIK